MPSNPGHPYSLGLNITVWAIQLPMCLFFLSDLAVRLSLVDMAGHSSSLVKCYATLSIILTIVFTLATIIADIVEILKITRKRMPLALYVDFAAKKTVFHAVYVLVGLIFGPRITIIMGGIMSTITPRQDKGVPVRFYRMIRRSPCWYGATSLIQLYHGAWIGNKMRKDGVAMTNEYELILNPADTAGYDEASRRTSYEDGAYENSPPPKENRHSKP
ncbi:hypothetical protein F4803DRAFT_550311 [Xylaria telfairii]|nr:hypothetical protein F4803DRAFT_550311 [Xylaria telfairii]